MSSFKQMEGVKRVDSFKIDPKIINIEDGFNPRQDYGNMKELKESIRNNGVKNPIRVYKQDDAIFVVDGHRRMRAVRELINEGVFVGEIRCITEDDRASEMDRIFNTVRCNDGNKFNEIEEGKVASEGIQRNLSVKDIAKNMGRSAAHVDECLLLFNAPKEIRDKFLKDEMSKSAALEFLRSTENPEKQVKIVQSAPVTEFKNGHKRITKKDAEKAVTKAKQSGEIKSTKPGVVKAKIKPVSQSPKSLMEDFYNDNFASFKNREAFAGFGVAVRVMTKEITTVEQILSELGLA